MKQLYGERGRDREGGRKKSISERLSICTSRGNVRVRAHARARTHAYRQADPDITIKTK